MSSKNNCFDGKNVLVAGGAGMVGIPLVQILIDRSARVRIASLDDGSRAHPQAQFVKLDLTNFDNCMTACHSMDFVFNLLCTKGSPATNKTNPASFLVPMLMYNTNLMEAARSCGVKSFLFTSSVCVYSPAEIFYENDTFQNPPSENDRWAGTAKRVGELQAQAYAIEYGWHHISIVRPSNVYGPYDNFDPFNAMVIPSLIRRVAEAKDKIVIWGDGSAERDFIYADDVARGMILAVEKQLNPNYPINLGVGFGISIKKLIETVVQASGKKLEIIWDISKPSGDKKRIMDISRAVKIGFSPQVSLEKGMERTYRWYLENRKAAANRYDIFDKHKTA